MSAYAARHLAPSRLRRRLAAAWSAVARRLRTGEFLLPPAPALPDDAPAAIIAIDGELTEAECERLRDEWDEWVVKYSPPPGGRWHELPALSESHPYAARTWMPRRIGDGTLVLGPDGCEIVPREPWARHAPETSADLTALPVVPRYLDAMPGGTE